MTASLPPVPALLAPAEPAALVEPPLPASLDLPALLALPASEEPPLDAAAPAVAETPPAASLPAAPAAPPPLATSLIEHETSKQIATHETNGRSMDDTSTPAAQQ
jgi:hypothetical protein